MNAPQALLAGRYRLVRVIASGGMGVVWEAWDERLERPVAIKQLHTVAGMPEEEAEIAKRRAMREGRITARLHHPHAVSVLDAVEHEGKPCLVMPLLPSTPLSVALHQQGTLPPADAVRIGAEVASALAAAHRLGIVHRDVKPGNILITPDGAAHISDFGISHAMGDSTLTGSGSFHGTPAYLAPEVARGREATFSSDVFSLGSTLYAAVEGEPPFGSEPNSLALLHKVAAAEVRPPRNAGALTPLLLTMLAKDPDVRPTMAEVAESLAGLAPNAQAVSLPLSVAVVQHPDPVSSPVSDDDPRPTLVAPMETADGPPPPPPPGNPPEQPSARRKPLIPVLVGVMVVAALMAVALLTGSFDRAPRNTDDPAAAPTSSVTTDSPESSPSPTAPEAAAPEPTPTPETTQTQESEPESDQEPNQEPDGGAQDGGPQDRGPQDRADQLAAAVTSYYELMPEDTDAAWPRMTGDYRQNHAGGRAAYEAFWDEITDVTVSDVQPVPPDRAEATLTYVFDDGRVVVERTAYRFAEEGGTLRIASTEVLSSTEA